MLLFPLSSPLPLPRSPLLLLFDSLCAAHPPSLPPSRANRPALSQLHPLRRPTPVCTLPIGWCVLRVKRSRLFIRKRRRGEAKGGRSREKVAWSGGERQAMARQATSRNCKVKARKRWGEGRPRRAGRAGYFLGLPCCSPSTPCRSCMPRSSASCSFRLSFCLWRVEL